MRALSIAYTSKSGSIYAHDPALKLNSLLLDLTLLLGLLKRGQYIDVDFDNEFIYTKDRRLHYRTPYSMPVTDEPNVLDDLLSITPMGGKAGIMRAYQPEHGACPSKKNPILGGFDHNALRL